MTQLRILVQFLARDTPTADAHLANLLETCRRMPNTPGCLQFERFEALLTRRAMP